MRALIQNGASVQLPAAAHGGARGESWIVRRVARTLAHRSQLKKLAESTLGSGNLSVAVRMPEGERLEEWIAVHST